jgi:hypothetical protein
LPFLFKAFLAHRKQLNTPSPLNAATYVGAFLLSAKCKQ